MVYLDSRQKNDHQVMWRFKISMKIIQILTEILSMWNVFLFTVAVSCKVILRVITALNCLF